MWQGGRHSSVNMEQLEGKQRRERERDTHAKSLLRKLLACAKRDRKLVHDRKKVSSTLEKSGGEQHLDNVAASVVALQHWGNPVWGERKRLNWIELFNKQLR